MGFICMFFSFSSPLQNGCFGDADIDRLKLADSYINGTQVQVNAETLQRGFLYSYTSVSLTVFVL